MGAGFCAGLAFPAGAAVLAGTVATPVLAAAAFSTAPLVAPDAGFAAAGFTGAAATTVGTTGLATSVTGLRLAGFSAGALGFSTGLGGRSEAEAPLPLTTPSFFLRRMTRRGLVRPSSLALELALVIAGALTLPAEVMGVRAWRMPTMSAVGI